MSRRTSKRRTIAVGDLSFFSFQDIITCVTGIMLLMTLMMASSLTAKPPTTSSDDVDASTVADPNDEQMIAIRTAQLDSGTALLLELQQTYPFRTAKDADLLIRGLTARAADVEKTIEAKAKTAKRLNTDVSAKLKEVVRNKEKYAVALEEAKKDAQGIRFMPGGQIEKPILVQLEAKHIVIGDLDNEGRPRQIVRTIIARRSEAIAQAISAYKPSDITVVVMASPQGVEHLQNVIAEIRDLNVSVGWDVLPDKPPFPSQKDDDVTP